MGLQIKVRHALGERVMELPDRTIEEPLTVGRATNAEVQVPSVTVSPRHCVLFIHEGRWAVQDLGAGQGTFVNGQPVEGARFLQIGDVIGIGGVTGVPTLEVDPAAVEEGRSGFAGTGLPHMAPAAVGAYGSYDEAPPFAPGSAYASAPVAGNAYGNGGYAAPRMRTGPIAPPQPVYATQASTPTDEIAFQPDVSSSQIYTRRKTSSNGGAIAVIIIVTILVGGLVTWVIVNRPDQQPSTVQIVKIEEPKKKPVVEAPVPAPAPSPRPTVISPIKTKPNNNSGKPKPEHGVNPQNAPKKPGSTLGNSVLPGDESTGSGTPPKTSTEPPSPGVVSPGDMKSPDKDPKKPDASSGNEGMDPIKKPDAGTKTPGGSGEMMDPVKPGTGGKSSDPMMDPVKPTTPATAPAPLPGDPELMDNVAANSWPAMEKLSKRPGKESFAIMRFDDYRRTHPGTHDAEIENFIDQKLDRIYWERVDQIIKKQAKLDDDYARTRTELLDVTDPEVKKKMIDAVKKMEAERTLLNKELRERMKYPSSEPPNLSSESALAELATKRDKIAYEGWKKITLNYIKANQGKLAWSGEQ